MYELLDETHKKLKPSKSTTSKFTTAARSNQRLMKRIGWQKFTDKIVRLLGFTNMTPNQLVFAEALAKWQARHKLKPDGILGRSTWNRMLSVFFADRTSNPNLFKRRLISRALKEWQRWAKGRRKEQQAIMTPVLQHYYINGVGLNPTAAQLQSRNWQRKNPWSAVFISYLMRVAGAGNRFRYSRAHYYYIRQSKRNRLKKDRSRPFWAYRVTELQLQPGDLVCRWRGSRRLTYDNFDKSKGMQKTHCDVVVKIRGRFAYVIGGNVGNSVNLKKVRIDSKGFLNSSKHFAIIRLVG